MGLDYLIGLNKEVEESYTPPAYDYTQNLADTSYLQKEFYNSEDKLVKESWLGDDDYTTSGTFSASEMAERYEWDAGEMSEFYSNYSDLTDVEKEYLLEKGESFTGGFKNAFGGSTEIDFSLKQEMEIGSREQQAYFEEQQAEAAEQRRKLESERLAFRRKETARKLVSNVRGGGSAANNSIFNTTTSEQQRKANTNQISALGTTDIV